MCGICYLKRGIHISQHNFMFNFFQDYLPTEFISKQDRDKIVNLSLPQHVFNQKLVLSPIHIQEIKQKIQPRGPDCFYCLIKSQKGQKVCSIQTIQNIEDGQQFLAQSTLSLRGKQFQKPLMRVGTILYNGQIYSTQLQPSLNPSDNDTEWLYSLLDNIPEEKLSIQTVKNLLSRIRGDFSLVYTRNQKTFICKDYFGKRSLLIGFQENGFLVTSVPIGKFQVQTQGIEQEQKEWLSKYKSQWNNSKLKQYFQIPRNTIIQIQYTGNSAIWKREYIYKNNLILPFVREPVLQSQQIIEQVRKILQRSMFQLVANIRQYQKYYYQGVYQSPTKSQGVTNSSVVVLFSGGLDSTLIARYLDLILPQLAEIDLMNIVFTPDAPDRITAIKAYNELKSLSNRKYNLILKNQTLNSIQEIQKDHMKLIYPKNTHMDFNISAVLSLASQLEGVLYDTEQIIKSKAKIILSGLGADQLFSGYSRYRVAYLRGGYEEQQREMIFDLDRLWIRNLGRDDRAIGNRAKQVRYPFLYSPLVDYLKQKVSLNVMADYSRPKGEGDKLILREVASQMGLKQTSKFKKTAIQFGTRLAKQSNIKAFGSNRKAKGTYLYQSKK